MANSGTVYSSYGRNSRVYVKWSVAETDIANNKWKINWEAGIIVANNDYWYSNAVKINSIYIDGGSSLGSGTYSNIQGTGTYKKLSGSKWISANSNGKKKITVSISGWFYSYGNVSGENTFDLPDIPRQATLVTAPNFSDTQNPTITYSNPAGNAATSLQACIASEDGSTIYIPYRDIPKAETSYTFELTESEKNALFAVMQNTSLSISFYVKTVIGSNTFYSHLKRTFTIGGANPIISASVIDVNETTVALTGDNTTLIKYFSNAQATVSAEAQKGAVIDNSLYVIRNGENTGYGETHTFENVESNVFIFSAEDNRGNIGVEEVELDMVDYIKLTCNMANNRPDVLGNMTVFCSGNFFNGSFGQESNTLQVQYRYKVLGGGYGEWENMTATLSGNRYSAFATFDIPDFNENYYYSFEARAIDRLDSITSTESAVKSMPLFHWGENDFVFEVPVEFKQGTTGATIDGNIEGDFNITGNLRLKGNANYGNILFFGDGAYCYISEPSDDVLKIRGNNIEIDTFAMSVYGYELNDFVVEQGTSGSWSYRKWLSGVAECWITVTHSTAVTKAWGSLYYGDTQFSPLDYPIEFISRPREITTLQGVGYAGWLYSVDSNTITKTGKYNVFRPAELTTAQTYYYDIHVIGKWK